MQDFDKGQSVEDAINTLAGNNQESMDAATFAQQQAMAQNQATAQNQDMSEARAAAAQAAAAAAYGKTQGYSMGGAAFNANGNPEAGQQNVSAADDAAVDADDELNMDEETDAEAMAAEISQLQGQVEILKQTVAGEHDKMLRALAEADNARKRAAQDVDRERKFALEKFVRSLLPVYDALEKALEYSDPNVEATKATLDGVQNTLDLFVKELNAFGVEVVDPTGKPFDPNFHQAVTMVPSPDVPANHVLNTMQKGFLLNGRVVRAAMVVVSKGV